MSASILSLSDISKSYSGVKVLEDIDFDINRGEVHALVGANGAGKSTMIKIISGAVQPDGGSIMYEGKSYSEMTPALSTRIGIEVVYQELNLIPSLSVAENIFLGQELFPNGLFDLKQVYSKAEEVLKIFELDIHPETLIRELPVAHMQVVEIAKAISQKVKVLILDEPTAPLTEKEVEILFKIIQQLKKMGVSIIYISHRLEEIFEISDRVTILRDGKKISTYLTKDTNRAQIISDMINETLEDVYPEINTEIGETVIEVRNLKGASFKDISFSVCSGEVFGLEGLVGARRTETARAIFGADRLLGGDIYLEGKKISISNPIEAIAHGIVMIPEDRKHQGIIGNLSVRWNVTLAILRKIQKNTIISASKEKAIVDQYIDLLQVRLREDSQAAATLSGGNQQKLVLAKWLASTPKVIIMDEPTRGIDVGAKKEFYYLINDLARQGLAIILISSEIDEMIGLCHRMLILSEGEAVTELPRERFVKRQILDYASGTK